MLAMGNAGHRWQLSMTVEPPLVRHGELLANIGSRPSEYKSNMNLRHPFSLSVSKSLQTSDDLDKLTACTEIIRNFFPSQIEIAALPKQPILLSSSVEVESSFPDMTG